MPMHDWTRVDDGAFHDFHQAWLGTLRAALNGGVLPDGYEARIEQHAPDGIPDVVTLQLRPPAGAGTDPGGGVLAAAVAPPKVAFTEEADPYTRRRRTLAVRTDDGQRLVALIEVVSRGNKASTDAIRKFRTKVAGAVGHGFHALVIDPFPPGKRDPRGIHPIIWAEFGTTEYTPPPDRPLTLVGYAADVVPRAYIEPTAVGRPLPDMPLFLTPDDYVNVPLESSYLAAWAGTARSTRRRLGE